MAVLMQIRERVGFHRDVYNSLVKSLIRQRKSGEFCDVILRVNRRTYPAHRAVLAASSPYFRSMFSTCMAEQTSREVDLSKSLQLDYEDSFKQVLDFMYCGDIEINVDNSEDIIRIADFLLFDDIKEYCRQFYLTHGNLNLSNCLWVSVLAEHHNFIELANIAMLTVTARFHDYFIHSNELLDLPETVLCRLLSDTEIVRFATAENITRGVARWVQQNSADGCRSLRRLVSYLPVPELLDECLRLISDEADTIEHIAQQIDENQTRESSRYVELAWVEDDSDDEDIANCKLLMMDEGDDDVSIGEDEQVLIAINFNSALKFVCMFVYRVERRRWYALPVHSESVMQMIPARLNVCSIMLHSSILYMFLSFNLPYPTDLQRLHIMAFDIELGRLSLLTFRQHANPSTRLCQTTLTDDRSVPPPMVHCADQICLVGNVEGVGHLLLCSIETSTYDCYRIPGTRFVSLARLAVRDDRFLLVWCRHRYGHEEFCVNREVSFAIFDAVERQFIITELKSPPSIDYSEFSREHILCVEEGGRIVIHTTRSTSYMLNETIYAWEALPASSCLPALKRLPYVADASYRGFSLTTHAADVNGPFFFFSNPYPYLTSLSALVAGRVIEDLHTPPPIDGISLAACGHLRSTVFCALPTCNLFDESYSRLIHKKTKQLYDTDTEDSAAGGATSPDSCGGGRDEAEDYDGFEYDDDVYGYFDDYEYERNINDF